MVGAGCRNILTQQRNGIWGYWKGQCVIKQVPSIMQRTHWFLSVFPTAVWSRAHSILTLRVLAGVAPRIDRLYSAHYSSTAGHRNALKSVFQEDPAILLDYLNTWRFEHSTWDADSSSNWSTSTIAELDFCYCDKTFIKRKHLIWFMVSEFPVHGIRPCSFGPVSDTIVG